MSFKSNLQNDLKAVFFNEDEFVVDAYIKEIQEPIQGHFKSKSEVVLDNLITEPPTLLIQQTDTQNIENDTQLTINSVIYYVLEIHKPSEGLALLYLSTTKRRTF